MDELLSALVVENGSSCKSGFAGDDFPISKFASVVGKPKRRMNASITKGYYVGAEAQSKRG